MLKYEDLSVGIGVQHPRLLVNLQNGHAGGDIEDKTIATVLRLQTLLRLQMRLY
jgi:hypothetical protein